MRKAWWLWGVSVLAMGACSTGYLAPDVAKFGETVGGIVTQDAGTPAARSLPGRVAAARRADFAAAGVQYGTSDRDACEYNRPDVSLTARPFSEACALVPLILSGGELVTAASAYDPDAVQKAARVIVPAGDRALLREHLGFALRRDLLAYAEALAALAKSTDPAEIGTAAGAAFDAVAGLQDAVSAAASETGEAAPAGPARAPARTLLTTLAREAAETARYRRLKAMVVAADPFVGTAAVQLAILTFEGERGPLEARAAALMAGIDDMEAGSAANLAEIETAHAALAAADGQASWRRYAGIAQTHAAIRAALQGPPDIARLSDANKRIVALATAFKDFAEAID